MYTVIYILLFNLTRIKNIGTILSSESGNNLLFYIKGYDPTIFSLPVTVSRVTWSVPIKFVSLVMLVFWVITIWPVLLVVIIPTTRSVLVVVIIPTIWSVVMNFIWSNLLIITGSTVCVLVVGIVTVVIEVVVIIMVMYTLPGLMMVMTVMSIRTVWNTNP